MTNLLPISNMPTDNLPAVLEALRAEQVRRQTENRLAYFKPYPKQLDFLNAGAKYRERLLMTCNRFGKTFCGAAEMAMHLTGFYPQWFKGKRFSKPVRAWAAGVTGETTRDVVQTALVGPPQRRAEWGCGQSRNIASVNYRWRTEPPISLIQFPYCTKLAATQHFSSNRMRVAERNGRERR